MRYEPSVVSNGKKYSQTLNNNIDIKLRGVAPKKDRESFIEIITS